MARSRPLQAVAKWMGCAHELGGLPCVNPDPHSGRGRGCVHHSTSGVPDRHDTGEDRG